VNETETSSSVINIHAEAADDSSAFVTGISNDLTNRITTDTSSSPLAWTPSVWSPNTLYSTPDIKDLVQDVVDRADWCGGNAMTFILDAVSGIRKAVSDDADESLSPALRIEYDETTATGCNAIAIQAQIKAQNDDAEERVSNGNMSFSSSDIELNADGGNSQIVGLRFQDINVSSSDTIVSADLEFTVDETDSGSTNVTIYGEYAGDSQSFSSTNKISTRTKTTAAVSWSPGAWTTEGDKHASPDISAIVEEIISHSGWSALNNMSFIIEGTSGERTADSYDGSPINAPKLRINIEGSGLGSSAGTISVRQKLHDVVDEIQWKSGTPIVDALYEAGLYYRGEDVLFGRTRGGGAALSPISENTGSRSELTRVSHEASYTGNAPTRDGNCSADDLSNTDCRTERIEGAATYNSPIEFECQDNHIVFLSDGQPSRWNLNETTSHYFDKAACDVGSNRGRCGTDIVNFLNNNDQIDDGTLDEDQKITTHTIGFNFAGSTYLQDLASNGGGGFYEAETASQLATVFTEIFADVLASPTSFVAPAVTINTFNRLSHRDELYFALFEPDDSPRWQGNLKRYRLDTSSGNAVIVDENDAPAVDGSTGYFSSSAQSWWSTTTDGQDIARGGFAGVLASNRKLYTNTGSHSVLSNASNKLQDGNSSLTNAMLNIVSEQAADSNFRSDLLSWINGVDVLDEDEDGNDTELRKYVGDPLHSRPALITYGGTTASPDTVAYFGTNEGFIHAVDVDDGSEIFSFMPQELLPNIKDIMANQGTPADHKYGVDGTITPWVYDSNGDNDLEDSGDFVYLYTGMRRGGNNYYALDVTSRDNPELLWTITGGSGDFAELGQSWSQPIKSKVDIGGTERDVLIFAGGYDGNQDDAVTPQNDNIGRALYIVDAITGARLWWAGPTGSGADLEVTDLNNSMPASPSVIDLDVDGKADHAYIGDLGGRVWRFDFTHGNNVNSFGSATLLATLGDTDSNTANDAENNRRFYHTPSVAFKAPLATQTLYVTIGSGFHAHPLNQEAHDIFYVLEDTDVINSGSMTLPLTEGDIYDATSNMIQDGNTTQQSNAQLARNAASGWYIRLEEDGSTQIGEKALSRATIFNNVLLFSTYLPEDPSNSTLAASCQAAAGFGRTYAVSLDDGSSVFNYNTIISGLEKTDRFITLNHVGIPPEVQIIIPDGSLGHGKQPVLLVGTEVVDTDFDAPQPEMIYWNDQ
jgi:type IV pilus assembly protein PilY1